MKKEVHIKIKGRVQGVGFRRFVVAKALEIGGISGWVMNASDGSVEVLMSGEEDALDKILVACRKGPLFARVDELSFFTGRVSSFLQPIEEGKFKRIW